MCNRFIKHFSKFTTFSPKQEKAIVDSMVVQQFKKGDFILEEGQLDTNTFFVMKGLVRQFRLVDGNEITTNFFTEDEWIISLNSFTENKKSTSYLICHEDTEVVVGGDEKDCQKIFEDFPEFETVSRAIMETVFLELQQFNASFQTDSAEQRYMKLMKSKPSLLQRVPQYQIASYIGVTPESLSRIRKRMGQAHQC